MFCRGNASSERPGGDRGCEGNGDGQQVLTNIFSIGASQEVCREDVFGGWSGFQERQKSLGFEGDRKEFGPWRTDRAVMKVGRWHVVCETC